MVVCKQEVSKMGMFGSRGGLRGVMPLRHPAPIGDLTSKDGSCELDVAGLDLAADASKIDPPELVSQLSSGGLTERSQESPD
jgi:hypothetical protein